MHDLTTMLSNFQKTAELKASTLRKEAAQIRAEPKAAGFPEMDRVTELAAKGKETEAAAWTERARVAKEGYLLVDSSDVSFLMDDHFRPLIDAAAHEHRIVYVEPVMDVNPLT
jgi:hypothetical protein